jgi:hypothetical protein
MHAEDGVDRATAGVPGPTTQAVHLPQGIPGKSPAPRANSDFLTVRG